MQSVCPHLEPLLALCDFLFDDTVNLRHRRSVSAYLRTYETHVLKESVGHVGSATAVSVSTELPGHTSTCSERGSRTRLLLIHL